MRRRTTSPAAAAARTKARTPPPMSTRSSASSSGGPAWARRDPAEGVRDPAFPSLEPRDPPLEPPSSPAAPVAARSSADAVPEPEPEPEALAPSPPVGLPVPPRPSGPTPAPNSGAGEDESRRPGPPSVPREPGAASSRARSSGSAYSRPDGELGSTWSPPSRSCALAGAATRRTGSSRHRLRIRSIRHSLGVSSRRCRRILKASTCLVPFAGRVPALPRPCPAGSAPPLDRRNPEQPECCRVAPRDRPAEPR